MVQQTKSSCFLIGLFVEMCSARASEDAGVGGGGRSADGAAAESGAETGHLPLLLGGAVDAPDGVVEGERGGAGLAASVASVGGEGAAEDGLAGELQEVELAAESEALDADAVGDGGVGRGRGSSGGRLGDGARAGRRSGASAAARDAHRDGVAAAVAARDRPAAAVALRERRADRGRRVDRVRDSVGDGDRGAEVGAVAENAVVVVVGSHERVGEVAVDVDARGQEEIARSAAGGGGGEELGLADNNLGVGSAGDVGSVEEDQNSVVATVRDIEPVSGGVAEHAIDSREAVLGGSVGVEAKAGLAEDGISGEGRGLGRGIAEDQNAAVEGVSDVESALVVNVQLIGEVELRGRRARLAVGSE